MTVQAKHYIEPSDIVAVCLECNNCHATVCLVVAPDIHLNALMTCPNCEKPWLGLPGASTIVPAVKGFVEAVNRMAETLKTWEASMKTLGHTGFALTLEIKESETHPPKMTALPPVPSR